MTTATKEETMAQAISAWCGENVMRCYQCKKCTAGCPMVDEMDLLPNEIMRALQFNRADKVLNSKTIWMCASCKTCTTRCPNEIDIAKVMDSLKSMALDRGVPPKVPEVATFIKAATRNIRWFGRLYEAGLAGEMNLRTGQPFKDMELAKKLLKSGKLRLFPELAGRFERPEPAGRSGHAPASSVAYYPGCSLKGTAREYDASTRAVAAKLDFALEEPKGWTCCGASFADWRSSSLGTSLSGKNLELVERAGYSAVTTPCAACFSHLRHASREAQHGEHAGAAGSNVAVEHLIDTFTQRVGLEGIKAKVAKPLKDLKAVCYYGCLLSRPPKMTGASNPEYPMTMDLVMRALGAQTLDWSYKTECCGASHVISRTESCLPLIGRILQNAKEVGAEVVIVACPMCQSNLDTRQEDLARRGSAFGIPVVYFTQMMGLALGVSEKEVGLDKLLVDPRPLLSEKGLLS